MYTVSGTVNLCEGAFVTLVNECNVWQCTGNTPREPGTVRRTARKPNFSLAIISVTVQLWI